MNIELADKHYNTSDSETVFFVLGESISFT